MAYVEVAIPKEDAVFFPVITALGNSMGRSSTPGVWQLPVQFEGGELATLRITREVLSELRRRLEVWEHLEAIRQSREGQ